MSVLSTRAKSVQEMPVDGIFTIYGDSGSGKTVLASTSPKTKEKPMLYIDILEGGTGSIPVQNRDNILVVEVTKFEEIDEILTDVDSVTLSTLLYLGYDNGDLTESFRPSDEVR